MIQTEVGHDAIDPGVERTLETEARQIDVRPEKRFLINVLPILRRTGEVDGQAQHGAIVLPHQFFEGGGVALLGLANQRGIVHADRRAPAGLFHGTEHRAVQVWRHTNFAALRHTHIRLPDELVTRSVHREDEARLVRLRVQPSAAGAQCARPRCA